MNGIRNHNEMAEAYLILRNGSNWKIHYQREIDSIYRIALNQQIDKR